MSNGGTLWRCYQEILHPACLPRRRCGEACSICTRQTATEVEGLIPKMQELAAGPPDRRSHQPRGPPQGRGRGLKTAADDVATRINGDVENAFATMFEQIGSGAKSTKDAFADFASIRDLGHQPYRCAEDR